MCGPRQRAAPAAMNAERLRFATTIQLLQQRLKDYDTERAKVRFAHALTRGAAAGVAVRGGLHLTTYILGLLLKKGQGSSSSRPGALELVQDTARWGAFLGTFAGVFVASDELIALLGGAQRTQAWRAFLSGALAGPAILLTGPKARHTSLALYVLVKGLALLVRCGNLPEAHPKLRAALAPTRWRHGDVALMCLCTMQVAFSWMVMPQTFPPSYARFLDKHGGKPPYAYAGVRELTRRAAAGQWGPFALSALQGTPYQHYCGSIPCQFWHPGHTCFTHIPAYFPGAYLRAMPVYFPVYVIPALFVHRHRLLSPKTAPHLWGKMAASILRSSLFLSCYCTFAFAGACAGFRLTGRTTGLIIAWSTWVAGLALLIEKKSRRMELAQYVLSRVIEAFGLCLVEWNCLSRRSLPPRLDVLLFSLATAAICHCYSDYGGQRRKVFRSSYLSAFDFILGNTGFGEASIEHRPSNADLLSLLERRVGGSWAGRLLQGLGAHSRQTPSSSDPAGLGAAAAEGSAPPSPRPAGLGATGAEKGTLRPGQVSSTGGSGSGSGSGGGGDGGSGGGGGSAGLGGPGAGGSSSGGDSGDSSNSSGCSCCAQES